ncbi:MAG: T9SS type B sorting domain-containing protein [Flavobacteriales bacterium]
MRQFYFSLFFLISFLSFSQNIELYQQFNGHYDYLAFGNTLNIEENGGDSGCSILTQSSANFTLDTDQEIVAAYLYWAGVGTGDLEVTLHGVDINAERQFSYQLDDFNEYFAAFADVTSILQNFGNDDYTLSNLDLTNVIESYCASNFGNATNFGGWAITVVYQDNSLPLNQVNVFDGLEAVSQFDTTLTITLDNLNVLDNQGAKIGFLAWEGDSLLAVNETLQINGNIISNPPLNPANNAFNGTNSFTNSSNLYNMDIDFYDIENNISPGDTSATITLTSGQDLVMVNNIITVLNTELPDATIEIDTAEGGTICGDREIDVTFTVYNVNSTATLPANTPIAFYANTTLVGQSQTENDIPVDGSESRNITLTIPESIPSDFILKAVVDDTGTGSGIVNEINEDNNEFEIEYSLIDNPEITGLLDLELCDVVGTELFNLSEATTNLDITDDLILTFHESETDAQNNENPILNFTEYENTNNPQTIFVRLDNGDCYVTGSFEIEVIICALPDATISVDNDLNACRQRDLFIEYTVFNTLGTAELPAPTPIAFYLENNLVAQSETQNVVAIGGSESNFIEITLPDNTPDTFQLKLVVDDDGTGVGAVVELNELNNEYQTSVEFSSLPPIPTLPKLLLCNEGFEMAIFDLTQQNNNISTDINDTITFYLSETDALENVNEIDDPANFQNTSNPQTIYVRLENDICFTTTSFLIETENCPPIIYDGASPNGDGLNDDFIIENLINVYENFELLIFSREGNLIYQGGNEEGLWDCKSNTGLLFVGNTVPTGTYFYVLYLNDPQYPDPFTGQVYVNY